MDEEANQLEELLINLEIDAYNLEVYSSQDDSISVTPEPLDDRINIIPETLDESLTNSVEQPPAILEVDQYEELLINLEEDADNLESYAIQDDSINATPEPLDEALTDKDENPSGILVSSNEEENESLSSEASNNARDEILMNPTPPDDNLHENTNLVETQEDDTIKIRFNLKYIHSFTVKKISLTPDKKK